MVLREAYEKYKKFKIPSLSVICEKASQYSKTCLFIIVIFLLTSIYLMQQIPHWQVAQFGINNSTEIAQLENSYRATLAQILGGSAVAVGIYFAWRNIKIAQESQITERFTRAIDQLGNPNLEIRLGGIYALERISNESEKDYWPIMEILTAYIRKNSPVKNIGIINAEEMKNKFEEYLDTKLKVPYDIQAILTVIGRRKYFLNAGESNGLDLRGTYLRMVNLKGAHLEGSYLYDSDLIGAHLEGAHLEGAYLVRAHLKWANLDDAHLEGANFEGANLEGAKLRHANLEGANLDDAHLERADLVGAYIDVDASLYEAHLEGAKLRHAHLKRANLRSAYLNGAYLDEANLEGAYIKGSNLNGAELIGANLEEAELIGANLEGAYLREANLKGAYLNGANLKGAYLKGARNLSFDQLSKVETLYNAELDEELLVPLKEKYLALFEKYDKDKP